MTEEYEEGCGIPFAEEYAELEAKEYAEQCKQPEVDLRKVAEVESIRIEYALKNNAPLVQIIDIIHAALKTAAGRV